MQIATRTQGRLQGVGEISTMATRETHSTEAYMDRVGKDKTYMDRVGMLVSLMETLKTLGVGEKSSVTAWAWRTSLDVGGALVMATIDLVGKNKSISWVVEMDSNLGVVMAFRVME